VTVCSGQWNEPAMYCAIHACSGRTANAAGVRRGLESALGLSSLCYGLPLNPIYHNATFNPGSPSCTINGVQLPTATVQVAFERRSTAVEESNPAAIQTIRVFGDSCGTHYWWFISWTPCQKCACCLTPTPTFSLTHCGKRLSLSCPSSEGSDIHQVLSSKPEISSWRCY